jgi:GNAT superfamily N-acetyltransferase
MAATILPASTAGWPAVESLFEQDAAARTCFCRWQKWTNAAYAPSSVDDRRGALRLEVEDSARSPGVVAYLGDDAVGWCAVEPRPVYRRLPATKVIAAEAAARGDDLDAPDVWAVTCFIVTKAARGQGVAHDLLAAAIETARAGGARQVVGYPVDPAVRPKGPAGLNVGTLSMFERAGFRVLGERDSGRPVVALDL